MSIDDDLDVRLPLTFLDTDGRRTAIRDRERRENNNVHLLHERPNVRVQLDDQDEDDRVYNDTVVRMNTTEL